MLPLFSGQLTWKSGQWYAPLVEHYQRIPDSVLLDGEISGEAVRVYGYLAGKTRPNSPNIVTKGHRLIAAELGLSRDTVFRALKSLEDRGHIVIDRNGRDRCRYGLCSDIFQRWQL